jgi:hypothetical protein
MEPETSSMQVKGYRPPDARLGWFSEKLDRTRAVLELKAPGADLDAKQGGLGRRLPLGNPRQLHEPAPLPYRPWTGLLPELRPRGPRRREQTPGVRLPAGPRNPARAVAGRRSPVYRLASHTHVEEERITKAFYVFYRDLRLDLFYQLRRDNPPPEGEATELHEVRLLEHAQKILDRVLFICFCEDKGLLPAGVLRRALTAKAEGFVQVTRWQQLCGLFDAVDRGHPPMHINGYDGGLFAKDEALDALSVGDESLVGILTLGKYDFETDLNVNILGHIFEQSISDLEGIRAEIRGGVTDKQRSRRRREGIFYTPEFITRFMVARTIGGWLRERSAELEARHRTGRPGPMSKETRLRLWLDYLEVLRGIEVLDLACGSGAFLVAAFDYLLGEYGRVNRNIAELTGKPGQMGLFDLDRQILQENLYGLDLNHESVEITKLGLWLKTARRDKPLSNLDHNIRCGNSLIEPPRADDRPELAEAFAALPPDTRPFEWREAFPEVFGRGGFDVVVSNPPYVRQESLGPLKPYFAQRYASYQRSLCCGKPRRRGCPVCARTEVFPPSHECKGARSRCQAADTSTGFRGQWITGIPDRQATEPRRPSAGRRQANSSRTGTFHPGTNSPPSSTSFSVSTVTVAARCTATVRLCGFTTMTVRLPAASQSSTLSCTST